MSDGLQKRDELVRLLVGFPAEAAQMEKLGQDIIQSARMAGDVAGPLLEIVENLPESELSPERLDGEIATWRALHETGVRLRASATPVSAFVAAASGVINTTASGVAMTHVLPVDGPDQRMVAAARTRLFDTLNRGPLVARARLSMARLDLDKNRGNHRPALDLLEEAAACIDRPAISGGRPSSVLIPLRGAIESVIEDLMKRRPRQEPAKKWSDKVASIGATCGYSYLAPAYFPNLCATITPLWDRLSGAKQDDLTREQVVELFGRGAAFLNALMDGVDETKLRA